MTSPAYASIGRWLESLDGDKRALLRQAITAPSGTAICACHNINAVKAGIETACWYCTVRAVLGTDHACDEQTTSRSRIPHSGRVHDLP